MLCQEQGTNSDLPCLEADPKTLTPERPSPVQRMKNTESREHASPVSFYHELLSLEHSLLRPHFYINTLYFIETKHKNSLFPGCLYSFLYFKKNYVMCTDVLTKYVFAGHACPRRPEEEGARAPRTGELGMVVRYYMLGIKS